MKSTGGAFLNNSITNANKRNKYFLFFHSINNIDAANEHRNSPTTTQSNGGKTVFLLEHSKNHSKQLLNTLQQQYQQELQQLYLSTRSPTRSREAKNQQTTKEEEEKQEQV